MAAALGALGALAVCLPAREAHAQLHWDGNAHAGITKRVLSGGTGGATSFGPTVGVAAHVALLPLVRIGAYADADASAVDDGSSRRFLAVGVRAKAFAPWVRTPFRAWLFAGVGYVGAYSPSYTRTLFLRPDPDSPPQPTPVDVDGAGGAYGEIPLGIGASYKLRKPWELHAELGARFGFGFAGTAYNGRSGVAKDHAELVVLPVGMDTLSLGLTLGIGFDM